MNIYRPSNIEIQTAMQQIRQANPQLGGYIDRAEQILLRFDIFYRNGWRIWSQADATARGESYSVGRDGCACYSYHSGTAPQIDGASFCKHRIALLAYMRILRNNLRDRWIGSDGNAPNIRVLEDYPNTFLAISHSTGAIRCGFGAGMALDFRTAPARDFEPTFATARDAYFFARWLYQAEPIPQPRPDQPRFLPDPTPGKEWQPHWSQDQFNEWLEHGTLPGEVPDWLKDQF